MKNLSDPTGNRTRDLPACSVVPQATAPPLSGICTQDRPETCWPPSRQIIWHPFKPIRGRRITFRARAQDFRANSFASGNVSLLVPYSRSCRWRLSDPSSCPAGLVLNPALSVHTSFSNKLWLIHNRPIHFFPTILIANTQFLPEQQWHLFCLCDGEEMCSYRRRNYMYFVCTDWDLPHLLKS
jgi:hypothetical protein